MKFYIGMMMVLFSAMPSPSRAVEIVAHRGSSDDAPENTVAAARLAWERRADAVELDVHLTRDGKLVVLHDANTKRTTGVDGLAGSMSLDELKKLDAGSWKHPRYAGERIPTLDELLATGGVRKRFFIEIKGGPQLVPELKASLQRSGLKPDQVVLIGFDLQAVTEAKRALPPFKVAWLSVYGKDQATGRHPRLDDVIAAARAAHLDGLDLSFQWPIDRAFVSKVKAAGLSLWTWTVDDPAVARRLIEAGVDGVTTNRPGWMREQLGL